MASEANAPMTDEEFEAAKAWYNRLLLRIPSPSSRTPHISRHTNAADRIEAQLQAAGHRTWGFLIYRTTYDSDEDWAEFLKRLRFITEDSFKLYNGMDILELMAWTVIEDRRLLDGASTVTVREHFRQWCETASRSEPRADGNTAAKIGPGCSPRYRYFIQVDAASLHSVVHLAPAPPDPDIRHKGWVKLIDAEWRPMSIEQAALWDSHEPIEGITERDVGWMKVPYTGALDEYYASAGASLNFWPVHYNAIMRLWLQLFQIDGIAEPDMVVLRQAPSLTPAAERDV